MRIQRTIFYNLKYLIFVQTLINKEISGVLLMAIIIVLHACNSIDNNRSIDEKYSSFLSEMEVNRLPVLIIPTRGCGPCIKSAMDFVRDSTSSASVSIVISGPTEKSCSLLMKKFYVYRDDAVFDIGTRANKLGIITIYPLMLSLRGNKLQVDEITPDNYSALQLY